MTKSLVIIGDGGHAKVIIDIILSQQYYKIAGCTSANLSRLDVMGIKVLGNDSVLPEVYEQGIRHAFVAIGDNKKRYDITCKVLEYGFEIINVISPKSYVSSSVKLGKGIALMPGSVINVDATIGDNVIVNTCASIDHDCILESNVHVAPGCNLAGNVYVGDGAFLGIGCKVIPEVRIGNWSIVGAGGAVVKDIPPYSTAIGIPAKVKQFN